MSKWKVHGGKGNLRGNFYLHHPDRDPSGWTHFTSWAEAIAEANKRARTVEVELTKPTDMHLLPSKRQRVDQILWGAVIRDTTNDYEDSGESVYIDTPSLRPLGEYLLALHYANERSEK